MIEQKAAGEEVAVQPVTEDAAPVPDLMSALKASLDAVREQEAARPSRRSRPRRRSAPRRKRKSPAKTG